MCIRPWHVWHTGFAFPVDVQNLIGFLHCACLRSVTSNLACTPSPCILPAFSGLPWPLQPARWVIRVHRRRHPFMALSGCRRSRVPTRLTYQGWFRRPVRALRPFTMAQSARSASPERMSDTGRNRGHQSFIRRIWPVTSSMGTRIQTIQPSPCHPGLDRRRLDGFGGLGLLTGMLRSPSVFTSR